MHPTHINATTFFINHYNKEDWSLATGKWQLNQKIKPSPFYSYWLGVGIFPPSANFGFYRSDDGWITQSPRGFPSDRYEIFSWAAESRSFATGAESATGGRFDNKVDLDAKFGFGKAHKGHSAQFRSTIQKRWTYWTQALKDMDFIPFD